MLAPGSKFNQIGVCGLICVCLRVLRMGNLLQLVINFLYTECVEGDLAVHVLHCGSVVLKIIVNNTLKDTRVCALRWSLNRWLCAGRCLKEQLFRAMAGLIPNGGASGVVGETIGRWEAGEGSCCWLRAPVHMGTGSEARAWSILRPPGCRSRWQVKIRVTRSRHECFCWFANFNPPSTYLNS